MDKIYGIEILQSRRSLPVVAGMKKNRMTTQNLQKKSNVKKKTNTNYIQITAGFRKTLLMQYCFKKTNRVTHVHITGSGY